MTIKRSIRFEMIVCNVAINSPFTAQSYPPKPSRLIVSSAPGETHDIAARDLASQLVLQIGQQFVVENRPRTGGIIGYEALASATPDSYTFG